MKRITRDHIRLTIAFIIPPVLAAIIIAPLIAIFMGLADSFLPCSHPPYPQPCGAPGLPEYAQTIMATVPIGAILGALIGWPAMVILGLPVHYLLMRKTKRHVWTYAGLGIFVGTLAMLAYFGVTGGLKQMFLWDYSWLALSGPLTGALAATLFWFIRRPDRTTVT